MSVSRHLVVLFGLLASTCVVCHVSQVVAMFSSVTFSQYVWFLSLSDQHVALSKFMLSISNGSFSVTIFLCFALSDINFAKTQPCFVSTMMW